MFKAYDNDTGCEVAWNVIKMSSIKKGVFSLRDLKNLFKTFFKRGEEKNSSRSVIIEETQSQEHSQIHQRVDQ